MAKPKLPTIHPLGVLLAIVGSIMFCCLGVFFLSLRHIASERHQAHRRAVALGLPATFDAYKVRPRPNEDASDLLAEFEREFTKSETKAQHQALVSRKYASSRERSAAYAQFVRQHPKLVRLENLIYQKRQLPINTDPDRTIWLLPANSESLRIFRDWIKLRRVADITGEPSKILDRYRKLLTFSRAIDQEPHWVVVLAGYSLRSQILLGCEALINNPQLLPAHLDEVEDMLQTIGRSAKDKPVILYDFAIALTFERQIITGRIDQYGVAEPDDVKDEDDDHKGLYFIRQLCSVPAFRDGAMAYYFTFLTRAYRSISFEPDQYPEDAKTVESLSAELTEKDPVRIVAAYFSSPYTDHIRRPAIAASRIRALKVSVNLIRKYGRLGPFPETVRNLPRDSFSGKSMLYRRRGKGFVISAIGPDLVDDRLLRNTSEPKDVGVTYLATPTQPSLQP